MSVRKRTWTTANGQTKEAWVVDYAVNGKRHIRTFAKKKEADKFSANAKIEVGQGIHTADSESITVAEAGELWIAAAEKNGLEQGTIANYRQHLRWHIVPYLGSTRLSRLSAPMVREFEDRLAHGTPAPGETVGRPRSQAMVRKIRTSLGGILADAQERGLVARNVVRELSSRRRRGKERRSERRQRGKLKVGVHIPTPAEIKAFCEALQSRWRPLRHLRPLLLTAVFTGLRVSELRGLRWSDVDLKKSEIHVRQRADRYAQIGRPKSEAGERAVPVPPGLLAVLKEWRLECPKGPLDLVFPNGAGKVENLGNIVQRGLIPAMVAAGVAAAAKDADDDVISYPDGEPVMLAKYTGMHALRHFYASWCINRKADGGLEVPAKVVQERLGHSSITMTLDVYGHLFPRGDDSAELAMAERQLLA
jgi:integrase